jgi:hypothetical protein
VELAKGQLNLAFGTHTYLKSTIIKEIAGRFILNPKEYGEGKSCKA